MDKNTSLFLSSQNSKMHVRRRERNKKQKGTFLIPLYKYFEWSLPYLRRYIAKLICFREWLERWSKIFRKNFRNWVGWDSSGRRTTQQSWCTFFMLIMVLQGFICSLFQHMSWGSLPNPQQVTGSKQERGSGFSVQLNILELLPKSIMRC